jgi:23S rRNA C2498 (ribose-2'-O)-methylase RlmM
LTQKDIKLYTNDQLEKNQRFITLKKREPKLAPQLVTEIVDKSAGVFLWVTLVVRSLLEGLQNSDRISDLQRRLKQLPAGLEDLYLLIMKNIEPFYEQQSSHRAISFKSCITRVYHYLSWQSRSLTRRIRNLLLAREICWTWTT